MKRSAIIKIVIGLFVLIVIVIIYKLLWTTIQPKLEKAVERIGLTSNEVAANGPIPGDISIYEKEWNTCKARKTPGYYSSINAAEISDGERSGLFTCATFTGSYTGGNKVFAWRSEDSYEGASYINTRKPNEIFIVGGDFPPLSGVVPSGPYVAKADASSGKQIWRSYFDNANISGRWIGNANLNIMPDGNVVFAWSNMVALIDGETGEILKTNTLPTGETPVGDANYKHLTIAPDETIIIKTQTRPTGSKYQGTMAIMKGVMDGFKQSKSYMVAVDPKTLRVIDEAQLPEPATVPHSITMFEGKIAIYLGVNSGALRYFWDPVKKKFSKDDSWVANPMREGQTTSDAPSILGDWIILQTNGIGSEKVASSIVAVNQKDPKRIKVVFPFGDLKKGEWSFAPPKPQTDPENSMIYSADMGLRKVAGIKLNQETGDLQVKFVIDDITNAFQPLIGPKDQRVLLLSNIKLNAPNLPIKLALFTQNYKEQVTWRNASTGEIIAQSDLFEPLLAGSLITPGFGGRVYFPTNKGVILMQVVPNKSN